MVSGMQSKDSTDAARKARLMKADAMKKLVSVAIILKDESGASRRVEFVRPDKVQGLLDDTTPLGDFLRDVAGVVEHKGVRGAN